jgi:3-mercaptopyruvate sulfurtransferase SseA
VQEHTSARAVLDLNAHGIKNTAALLGGWSGWIEAKEPTEKAVAHK